MDAQTDGINSKTIRRIILDQSKRAGVGHIGCALSVADIIAALYSSALNINNPDDPERDRFVMSKGHAALALYAACRLKGWLTKEELDTFCGDGTRLGIHPERAVKGIDFTTGSLGHGLSIGAGAALAAGLQKSPRRIFVLLSDAECNEGSVWEAAMFAAHHKLSNLIAIIDLNGQQALGHTKDILNLEPLAGKWKSFGWDAREADGHDVTGLSKTISKLKTEKGPPHVLVARTVFGKGVSFMENKIKWHYSPMSDDEYKQAICEIENTK